MHALHYTMYNLNLLRFMISASNNLTYGNSVEEQTNCIHNNYMLSTLSQLADNVQVTRIASNKDGRE